MSPTIRLFLNFYGQQNMWEKPHEDELEEHRNQQAEWLGMTP